MVLDSVWMRTLSTDWDEEVEKVDGWCGDAQVPHEYRFGLLLHDHRTLIYFHQEQFAVVKRYCRSKRTDTR